MTDAPESHTLALLREMRAETQKSFQQTVEAFERVYAELAEVKAEILRCREDVAGADLASKQVAVRLTLLEQRVKALEERPQA
jgi:hypothetical protein